MEQTLPRSRLSDRTQTSPPAVHTSTSLGYLQMLPCLPLARDLQEEIPRPFLFWTCHDWNSIPNASKAAVLSCSTRTAKDFITRAWQRRDHRISYFPTPSVQGGRRI